MTETQLSHSSVSMWAIKWADFITLTENFGRQQGTIRPCISSHCWAGKIRSGQVLIVSEPRVVDKDSRLTPVSGKH